MLGGAGSKNVAMLYMDTGVQSPWIYLDSTGIFVIMPTRLKNELNNLMAAEKEVSTGREYSNGTGISDERY